MEVAAAPVSTDQLTLRILQLGREGAIECSVNSHSNVLALKTQVKQKTTIPEGRQRLIYRGRVLEDAALLSSYSLENGHTIHCVARPEGVANQASSSQTTTDTASTNTAAGGTSTGGGQGQRRIVMGAIGLTGQGALSGSRFLSDLLRLGSGSAAAAGGPNPTGGVNISTMGGDGNNSNVQLRNGAGFRSGQATAGSSTGDNQAAQRAANIPNPTSLEHVRQGLMTVHTLLSGMEPPERRATRRRRREERSVEGVSAAAHQEDHSRRACEQRRFYIGQWLDVKDTVNQWLEATVIDIDNVNRRLKITYNGWPARWDEWLDFSSPCIAPFRTRTLHSAYSAYISPSPITNIPNAPNTGTDDVRRLLPEVLTMFRRLESYLSPLAELCEEDLVEEEAAAIEGSSSSEMPRLDALPWDSERMREERIRQRREEGVSMMVVGRKEEEELGCRGGEGSVVMNAARGGSEESNIGRRSTRARRKRQVQDLAADVAPLLDRCGRLLADLAPHVSRLSSSSSPSSVSASAATPSSSASTTISVQQGGGGGGIEIAESGVTDMDTSGNDGDEEVEGGEQPVSSVRFEALPLAAAAAASSSSVSVDATNAGNTRSGRSVTRDGTNRSIRSRTPSPDTVFRQLVSTPAMRGGGGAAGAMGPSLDIHIAFLTPMRGGQGGSGGNGGTVYAGAGGPSSTSSLGEENNNGTQQQASSAASRNATAGSETRGGGRTTTMSQRNTSSVMLPPPLNAQQQQQQQQGPPQPPPSSSNANANRSTSSSAATTVYRSAFNFGSALPSFFSSPAPAHPTASGSSSSPPLSSASSTRPLQGTSSSSNTANFAHGSTGRHNGSQASVVWYGPSATTSQNNTFSSNNSNNNQPPASSTASSNGNNNNSRGPRSHPPAPATSINWLPSNNLPVSNNTSSDLSSSTPPVSSLWTGLSRGDSSASVAATMSTTTSDPAAGVNSGGGLGGSSNHSILATSSTQTRTPSSSASLRQAFEEDGDNGQNDDGEQGNNNDNEENQGGNGISGSIFQFLRRFSSRG